MFRSSWTTKSTSTESTNCYRHVISLSFESQPEGKQRYVRVAVAVVIAAVERYDHSARTYVWSRDEGPLDPHKGIYAKLIVCLGPRVPDDGYQKKKERKHLLRPADPKGS